MCDVPGVTGCRQECLRNSRQECLRYVSLRYVAGGGISWLGVVLVAVLGWIITVAHAQPTKLAQAAHIYDLRSRKYLGRTDRIQFTLEPWQPSLFALLPEEVPAERIVEHLLKL